MQIDIKLLINNHAAIEDFLDTIVAEARADDEDVAWDVATNELKKAEISECLQKRI